MPKKQLNGRKRIKDWSRRKKEALMSENWEDLIAFSKSKISI